MLRGEARNRAPQKSSRYGYCSSALGFEVEHAEAKCSRQQDQRFTIMVDEDPDLVLRPGMHRPQTAQSKWCDVREHELLTEH